MCDECTAESGLSNIKQSAVTVLDTKVYEVTQFAIKTDILILRYKDLQS